MFKIIFTLKARALDQVSELGKVLDPVADYLTKFALILCFVERAQVLKEITQLPQSALELAESLEQLRWLENGYKIKVGITEQETIGIDTPEDMEKALAFLANR